MFCILSVSFIVFIAHDLKGYYYCVSVEADAYWWLYKIGEIMKLLTMKIIVGLFMFVPELSALKTDQRGRSFLIAFPEKDNDVKDNVIVVTSEDDAVVYVKLAGQETEEYEIEAMGTVHIPFPRQPTLISDSQIHENTALIVASAKVSVYGYAIGNESVGGFLAFPIESLDTKYLVVGKSDGGASQLAVAAVEDSTELSITMRTSSITTCGRAAVKNGEILRFTLNKRQALHLDCSSDTSGTLIQADKPVAVFSGSSVNEVIEMMPPVKNYGKEYILYPILGTNRETVYRILAVSDNTTVSNSLWTHKLGSQDFVDVTIKETDYTCFKSTKPVMVAQFTKNQNNGDILTILPSVDHFAADYIMDTSVGSFLRNVTAYVTAIIPETTHIELNFMPLSAMHDIAECQHRVGTASIPRGIIRLSQSNGSPFGIIAYGFGKEEMYSFPAGMTFDTLGENQCENVLCKNKGLCYEIHGTYECFCPRNYTGRHCEFEFNHSAELFSRTTESPQVSTPNCECKCANITWEEVYEKADEVKKELTVDKTVLSKQKRRKVTAEDTRPSSTGVGYVGATILISVFGSIFLMDFMSVMRYFFWRIRESRENKPQRTGSGFSFRRKHLLHVRPEGIVLHMMDRGSRTADSCNPATPVGN